jgi:hypothetical protein
MWSVIVILPHEEAGRYVQKWTETYAELELALRVARARAVRTDAVVLVQNGLGRVVARMGLAA